MIRCFIPQPDVQRMATDTQQPLGQHRKRATKESSCLCVPQSSSPDFIHGVHLERHVFCGVLSAAQPYRGRLQGTLSEFVGLARL